MDNYQRSSGFGHGQLQRETGSYKDGSRVYFVNDSKQVRNRLIEATSDLQGVSGVYGNSDPVQALQEIVHFRPEIVVLDIRMKGEVGFDLLKQLKDELPETIRIVFTWWIAQEYEDESMNAGADYFYGNGDEFEDLFSTIRSEAMKVALDRRTE